MVSFKILLAALPFALQALAAPSAFEIGLDSRMVCVEPTNCGSAVGNCEFCCNAGIKPNSPDCHTHNGNLCDDGQTQYHCDEDH